MDYIWRAHLLLIVLITAVTAPPSSTSLPTPPTGYRYCNNDFTTEGPCMELVSRTDDWHNAKTHCRNNLEKTGELVIIKNQTIQDWVAGVLQFKGWNYAWFNGCIKLYMNKRFWFWQRRSGAQRLSYQGCFEDDPSMPELPIWVPPPISSPTECINKCSNMSKDIAGVQQDSAGIVCRCGDNYGQNARSHDEQCNDLCTPPGNGVNKYCGGSQRQLIYTKGGQRFHAFAYSGVRDYEHCVVLDHRYEYYWTEQDCHNQFYYICWHKSWSPETCTQPLQHYVYGQCISIHNQLKDFYQATVDCFNQNADLVYITESGMFSELLSRGILHASYSYWIGLTDEEWVDANYNPILSYFNWAPEQPNAMKNYDCLKMSGSSSRWYNSDCQTSLNYMCIVDVPPPAPAPATPAPATPAPATPAPATPAPATPAPATPAPATPAPATPAPATPAPATLPTTSGSQAPTQATIGGLSQDLIIGLGAGAGAALVIAILACLCFCFWRRQAKEKSRKRKSKKPSRSHSRDLPEIPEEQLAGAEYYTRSNQGYVPDLLHEHPGKYARAHSTQSSRSGASYADITPSGYEDLDRGSVGSHTYNKLNHDYHKYEYIDMPAQKKYASNRSGGKAGKGGPVSGKSSKPSGKSGHASNRSRHLSDRSDQGSTRSGHESTRSGHESTRSGHESTRSGHESTRVGMSQPEVGMSQLEVVEVMPQIKVEIPLVNVARVSGFNL